MRTHSLPFWKRQLPNMITWARIGCIPPVIVALSFDTYEAGAWATFFFVMAAVSDFFDGYFARIFQVETLLGKFLDPIADKLLVMAALIMLIALDRIWAPLVILLLSRDFLINGLRSVAASQNFIIGAGSTGKWKTGAQMTAIPLLMLKHLFGIPLVFLGQILLWTSLILSLASGVQYALEFMRHQPTSK